MKTIDHALHNLIVDKLDKLDIEYDVPNMSLAKTFIHEHMQDIAESDPLNDVERVQYDWMYKMTQCSVARHINLILLLSCALFAMLHNVFWDLGWFFVLCYVIWQAILAVIPYTETWKKRDCHVNKWVFLALGYAMAHNIEEYETVKQPTKYELSKDKRRQELNPHVY